MAMPIQCTSVLALLISAGGYHIAHIWAINLDFFCLGVSDPVKSMPKVILLIFAAQRPINQGEGWLVTTNAHCFDCSVSSTSFLLQPSWPLETAVPLPSNFPPVIVTTTDVVLAVCPSLPFPTIKNWYSKLQSDQQHQSWDCHFRPVSHNPASPQPPHRLCRSRA